MGRPERDLDEFFKVILFEKNKVVAGVDDLLCGLHNGLCPRGVIQLIL